MKVITPESIITRIQKESFAKQKLPDRMKLGPTVFFAVYRLYPSYLGAPRILYGIPFDIDWTLDKKKIVLEYDDDKSSEKTRSENPA